VTRHFGVPAVVCLNRADLSAAQSAQIESMCVERDAPLVGRIPFDRSVVEATVALRPAVEVASERVRTSLTALAEAVHERLLAQ
jgi:MinD superfamily P-loop ATPase